MNSFIRLLKTFNLHLVGSRARGEATKNSDIDTVTTHAIPQVFKKLSPYLRKVYREGNNFMSVLVEYDGVKYKLDVFFVSSLIFGKWYFTLPSEKIIGIRRYIRNKKPNYNLNQYGLYKNNILMKNIRSYKQVKNELGLK